MNRSISIKRRHGLGNLIMLLPVLDFLVERGLDVELVTHPRWVAAFNELRPSISFTDRSRKSSIDLDEMTLNLRLAGSKTLEFATLLGVEDLEIRDTSIEVPDNWKRPYEHLHSSIGFAPEAGHRGRQWPKDFSLKLSAELVGTPLALIGWETEPSLESDFDFRGVPLDGLFGSISCLKALISMDSGAMHVARALKIPTVALFGGIDPQVVTNSNDRLIALQSGLSCFPCNKNETCGGTHDCIKGISPQDVITALKRVEHIVSREIVTVR